MVEADQPDSRFPIDTLSLRRFLLSAQHEVRLSGEVNVRITSDEEMRRLNREFRGKNEPTDVLSFPASLNGKSNLTGDIAISAEIAYANAGALRHPFEEELKILMLHGLLHLAGHDHEKDHGEMARLEQRLRARLKLPTGLIERTNALGTGKVNVDPAAPGRVFGSDAQALRLKKDLGKGTALAVPSKQKPNPITSLPKAAAQRKRSGKKKSTPLISLKTTSGAKAQNDFSSSSGTAKAVPFPKARKGNTALGQSTNPPAGGGRFSFSRGNGRISFEDRKPSLSHANPARRRP